MSLSNEFVHRATYDDLWARTVAAEKRIAALESQNAALLNDVNQDEGYERLKAELAISKGYEDQNHRRILELEAALADITARWKAQEIHGGKLCAEAAKRFERILALEAALTKVHGIVAEYWGPCPGSVETLLMIRDAMGAKDWRPNVDYMPRLLTSSETDGNPAGTTFVSGGDKRPIQTVRPETEVKGE